MVQMKVRISLSQGFFPLLFSSLIILSLVGCAQENNISANGEKRQLSFSVTTSGWNSLGSSFSPQASSRALPISGTTFDTSKSFNMIADQNDGSGNYSTLIDKEPVSYSNNIWKTTKDYYWSGNSNKTVSFYAYYPTDISKDISHTAGSTPTLLYTVPNDVASQPDIIVASKENVAGNTTMSTDLTFNHIFAAVQFSVGSDGLGSGTISSVSIGDVHDSGTYTFGSGWTLGTSTRTFTISQPETISGTSGEDIYSGTYTLMMIPQTISNATVTVTYSNGSTLTKTISGMWGTGKTYIYNLSYPPRTFSYTGTVQTYKVPVTGTYKLEVWGAEGSVKGGYSSGTKSLSAGTTLYIYVGGKNSDGSFLNGDGSTDIRLNGLIYTPPETGLGTTYAYYFGPYWRNSSIGTYQVDATGIGFEHCGFTSYCVIHESDNQVSFHHFTITKIIKTSSHYTVYIDVDQDASTSDGIELLTHWDDTQYDVSISNAAISKLSDRIIVGAGDNSNNSISGVANGVSQDHVWSGNGMARITLLSIP
jgi:hypothetical protein